MISLAFNLPRRRRVSYDGVRTTVFPGVAGFIPRIYVGEPVIGAVGLNE